jgi:xanthine dehydrogenase accessory factor
VREVLPELEKWLADGEAVAIATVISTWGSAPRPAGSVMAISASGGLAGSVSGGCVESAVVNAAKDVLASHKPQKLHFDVSDESAWSVGLTCGGQMDVLVQPADPKIFAELLPRLKAEEPMTLSTALSEQHLGAQTLYDAKGAVIAGDRPEAAPSAVLNTPLPASPTLMLIGGVHIGLALDKLARSMGFRTVVVDPRKFFTQPGRFDDANEVLREWPEAAFGKHPITAATAIATLSHDPKIDDPALIAALRSPAFYAGALGSKRTTAARRERLLAAGLTEAELARLHAPIGLEINAETPEEIALAVMAQVVKAYRENKTSL